MILSRSLRVVAALWLGSFSLPAAATVFFVSNTADSGAGSLRQAILDANGTPGSDEIRFSLGSGPQTISPLSPLPTITEGVAIFGSTDSSFRPLIELNGFNAGAGANGLHLRSVGSSVNSLVINRFQAGPLGSGGNGIWIETGSGNSVVGCYIGTNLTGAITLGNGGNGIDLADGATGNTIGAPSPPGANIIGANGGNGIALSDPGTTFNTIQNNWIGTLPILPDTTVGSPVPNSGHGIAILAGASSNAIGSAIALGGAIATIGNTIAYNLGDGVFVESGSRNQILWNSIFDNVGLGIDLAPAGVTANDPGDTDSGAHNLQNFPVLTSATTSSVTGALHSLANTTFGLQFFSSQGQDPSGHGEGQAFVGHSTVTTDAAGDVSFTAPYIRDVFLARFITATATDPAGNTSEFSAPVPVSASFYTVAPCRVADTRDPDGPYGGPPLVANLLRAFRVGGQCGIPENARAVSLNVTVTSPSSAGHLTLFPPGGPLPQTSAINYRAGQTRANNAITTLVLGAGGDLLVQCTQTSGTVHVILDVNGYFQ